MLAWSFPLAPCQVELTPTGFAADFETVKLDVDTGGLTANLEQGWYSPGDGARRPSPIVRVHGRSHGEYRHRLVFRVSPVTRAG